MTKISNRLKKYISQVPIWGALSLIVGVIFAIIILSSQHEDDWSIYYIPFKLLGAFLGYMWVAYWNPGQLVTFHLGKFTPTEDEKALNNLILKYRSKKLIPLFPLLFIIVDLIIGMSHYQTQVSYLDGYFAFMLFSFFVTAATSTGVKSISAWWNIRKNWKKEFEN